MSEQVRTAEPSHNPHWRREAASGLLRAARDEWFTVLFMVAADAWAFWHYGAFAGIGWALCTINYVFAFWMFREAREGWGEAGKLAKLLAGVAKGTHEVKLKSEIQR